MSGVRVCSEELLAAGLTLPGFVERSEVIASLPSLSLLTMAALTPGDCDVSYHEIADLKADGLPEGGFDLVAISSMTAQAFEAYEVAGKYRAAGIPVVMGGLHATVLPDEVLEHCDAVVVGEGEGGVGVGDRGTLGGVGSGACTARTESSTWVSRRCRGSSFSTIRGTTA